MKKIILSAAILAGLAFVSCNKDDDKDNNNSNCVTCEAKTVAGFNLPEQRVCRGDNGNAFEGSDDTGVNYDDYVRGQRAIRSCN